MPGASSVSIATYSGGRLGTARWVTSSSSTQDCSVAPRRRPTNARLVHNCDPPSPICKQWQAQKRT
eukprot:scaffold2865_cov356-Prasinococcus_capsulatus_cf.AAC.7